MVTHSSHVTLCPCKLDCHCNCQTTLNQSEPFPHRRVWDPRNAGLLLQECHAAHATYGTAQEHSQAMIQLYEEWARDVAGLPVVAGRRSARGTLRGAVATYTLEALVGDGRALQVRAAVSCVRAGG